MFEGTHGLVLLQAVSQDKDFTGGVLSPLVLSLCDDRRGASLMLEVIQKLLKTSQGIKKQNKNASTALLRKQMLTFGGEMK